MSLLRKSAPLFIILLAFNGIGQTGGTRTYRFLDVPMTARAAALGGNSMAIWDNDIHLLYSNPSLLNPGMAKQVALNYCNYVGDMNFWYLAHAHDLKKYGVAAMSLQAYGYGTFKGYDETGVQTADFKASDYSVNMTYAKSMADSSFNIGATLKTIISQYDIYHSYGNAIDFGVTYHDKNQFTISLLAKNVGYMWKSYSGTQEKEALPQTVQLGFSKKVPKAPFRIIMVYDQLLKWNLQYISPVDTTGKSNSFSSTDTRDSSSYQKFMKRLGDQGDNFMRHLVVGTEVLITKNFNLRIAYNYRRQREMTLPERRGASGLSFGIGLRGKRFSFSYAFTKMAFPGNSHLIGITLGW
jgi:hypothetical protein